MRLSGRAKRKAADRADLYDVEVDELERAARREARTVERLADPVPPELSDTLEVLAPESRTAVESLMRAAL